MREQDNIYNKKGGALLSKRPSYKRMSSASMTVEACFVLPFFLFAFLNIISIIDIYRLQGSMSSAMHMTAKQMAVYAYEYKEVKGGDEGYAASLGLTYAYAANKVKSSLGEDYPSSVSWLRSSVLKGDECIDLIAQYTVKPPISLMGYGSSLMYNRIRTRAWTGYDNAKKGEGAGDEEIVYITETGTVYHRTRTCTYLKLSIRAVDKSSLDALRSEDGGKYYACEECGKSDTSTVYITNYGNRYHTKLSCSKLKRTIMAVPISEVGDKGACSKCG
jgi:hypothetical protein